MADTRSEQRPRNVGSLIAWLRSEAADRLKQANGRLASARVMRNANADELTDAKRLAERMAGRKLPLATATTKDARRGADLDERIAETLIAEATQIAGWADVLLEIANAPEDTAHAQ